MAPNVILNLFPTKQLSSLVKTTASVTERTGFPPKPTDSATKASNSVTERLVSSPVNRIKQLVFTEFGLSPVIRMPSPELSLSPAEANSTLHLLPLKPGSPISHPQPKIKATNGCRCKQSRCLKLYCECFAAGAYCDGCNCNGCRNNVENEVLRQAAAKSILERNPYAFSPKIASSPFIAQDSADGMKRVLMVGKHNRGCSCKRTKCLKKYCECYHAEVLCSENCKCVDCKNFEGCEERMALSKRDYSNTETHENFAGCEEKTVVSQNSDANIKKNFEGFEDTEAVTNGSHGNTDMCRTFQGSIEKITFPGGEYNKGNLCVQPFSAVTSTATGLSGNSCLEASKKRKFLESLDSNAKDPLDKWLINDQKEANPLRVSGPFSASSVVPLDHVISSTLGSSKFRCRSILADMIRSRDVEQLCSFLVLLSEAANVLTDKNGTLDTQAMRENETELGVQDKENSLEGSDVKKEVPDDQLNGNQAHSVNTDNLIFGGIDGKTQQASSLGNVGLMCDKKDRSPVGATTPDLILNNGWNADVYMRQEKLVLASFRNLLMKIITLGNMKGQHVDNPLQKMNLQHE